MNALSNFLPDWKGGLWLFPLLKALLLFFFFTVRKPASEECTVHINEETGEQGWLKLKIIFFPLSFKGFSVNHALFVIPFQNTFFASSKPRILSLVICSAILESGSVLPAGVETCEDSRNPVLCPNQQNLRLRSRVMGRKWGNERKWYFGVAHSWTKHRWKQLWGGYQYRVIKKCNGEKWIYLYSPLRSFL